MPIMTEESVILSKIKNLVVDETSRKEVINAIKNSPDLKIPNPNRAINIAIRENIVSETFKDDVSYIYPIIEKKGGEKMNYKTGITPGEEKISKAILDHFKPGFKAGKEPTKMVFEACLKQAVSKIDTRISPELAMHVLIRGEYIEIKKPVWNFLDEKVVLGKEGKKYLSL